MLGCKDFLCVANPVALCGEVSGSSSPLGRRLYAGFEAVPRGPAIASLGGVAVLGQGLRLVRFVGNDPCVVPLFLFIRLR